MIRNKILLCSLWPTMMFHHTVASNTSVLHRAVVRTNFALCWCTRFESIPWSRCKSVHWKVWSAHKRPSQSHDGCCNVIEWRYLWHKEVGVWKLSDYSHHNSHLWHLQSFKPNFKQQAPLNNSPKAFDFCYVLPSDDTAWSCLVGFVSFETATLYLAGGCFI